MEIVDEIVGKDNTTIYLKNVTDMNSKRQKNDEYGNDNENDNVENTDEIQPSSKKVVIFTNLSVKERLSCNKKEEKYDNQ